MHETAPIVPLEEHELSKKKSLEHELVHHQIKPRSGGYAEQGREPGHDGRDPTSFASFEQKLLGRDLGTCVEGLRMKGRFFGDRTRVVRNPGVAVGRRKVE